MRTPPTFQRFAVWIARRGAIIFVVCLLPAIASFFAHFFLSEAAQEVTGTLQATFTLLSITFAVPYVLFIPRSQRVTRFLELWPISVLRLLLFSIAMPVLVFMVLHAAADFVYQVL